MIQRKTAVLLRNARRKTGGTGNAQSGGKARDGAKLSDAGRASCRRRSTRLEKAEFEQIIREITVEHEQEHDILPAIVTPDGEPHFYLNAAIPKNPDTGQPLAPLTAGICGVCGHAYAELIRKAAKITENTSKSPRNEPKQPQNPEKLICGECLGDAWFAKVLDLESGLGMRLDTGTVAGRDLRHEREKYDLKASQTRRIKSLEEESNSALARIGRKKFPRTND
jgi:hypothetical protein